MNRDFEPFAFGTEAFAPEFLPPLAKAKLDEFFLQVAALFCIKGLYFLLNALCVDEINAFLRLFLLQWLSQVDVQEWLAGVISGGIPLNNVSPSTAATANNTSPPPRSPSGCANLSSPLRCRLYRKFRCRIALRSFISQSNFSYIAISPRSPRIWRNSLSVAFFTSFCCITFHSRCHNPLLFCSCALILFHPGFLRQTKDS
jgi:hypothetical protein